MQPVPNILLEPFFYKGFECIGLSFKNNKSLNEVARRIKGIRWNEQKNSWYISCNRSSYELIIKAFEGIATIETSVLKKYLEQRKTLIPITTEKLARSSAKIIFQYPLEEENLKAYAQYRDLLILKGYSANTIRNYCNEFHQLLRLLGKRNVADLVKPQILSYLLWLLEKQGCSETKLHTTVNAIKFYFEKLLGRGVEYYDLPRPKKPFKLPDVLAEEEVLAMIQQLANLKHRTILMAGYAGGLRVSEIIGLKLVDIDSKRMMIHIHGAKWKKIGWCLYQKFY